MARVITVANPRTGSGKTTTVSALGEMLVDLGQSVLVVDLDPQAALTTRLGVDAERIGMSLYDVIMLGERAVDAMVDTDARVDLLPAALELSGVEAALVTRSGREQLVKDSLREVRDDYDFILVDCASSLGILTQNGLSMADLVIVPMVEYSQRATAQLIEAIDEISKFVNPSLAVLGVLPTNVDTVAAREISEAVQQEHGLVALPPIPSGTRALNAYRELAKTLLTR